MFCPKCGMKNLDDSAFCEGCGELLAKGNNYAQINKAPAHKPVPPIQNDQKSKRRIIITAAIHGEMKPLPLIGNLKLIK